MRRLTHHTNKQEPRGVVLLLALIVIAALTAAGIGASTIVVNEFKTLASTDHGIRAFYAADIGMERSLFTLFNNRLLGTSYTNPGPTTSPLVQIQQGVPLWDAATGNPPPQNKTSVSAAKSKTTSTAKTFSIMKSQVKQLDLTKDDAFYSNKPARTLYFKSNRIRLAGDATDDLPWIEISYTYFLNTSFAIGAPDVSPSNSTVRVVSKKNLAEGVKIILYNGMTTSVSAIVPENPIGVADLPGGVNPSDISGYLVRFRALQENILGMTAYACWATDDSDCATTPSNQFTIGSDMTIVSRGSTEQASIILTATVPIRFPASGAFDYVLFSEQGLDKSN